MKFFIALFLVALSSFVVAAETRDFPSAEPRDWKEISTTDLPKGVFGSDFTDAEGSPVKQVQIRYFDFDLDGNQDLLVAQGSGGTGPSIFHLYTWTSSGYIKSLTGEGGVVSLGRVSDIPQIETWVHSSGNDFTVIHYAFLDGKWIEKDTEILRRTEDDRLLILERRNTKTVEQDAAANP